MTLYLSCIRKNSDEPNKLVKLLKTIHGLHSDYTHGNNFFNFANVDKHSELS